MAAASAAQAAPSSGGGSSQSAESASARCGKLGSAFAGAAPASVGAACEPTAAAALATAPRSIAVSGLGCHPDFNAEYVLQPAPRSGRAQYATHNGRRFLYWTPSDGLSGTAEWLLDGDADDTDYEAFLLSSAEAPPTGSAVWTEGCGGQFTNARLRLDPGAPPDAAGCATALAALAPSLTAPAATSMMTTAAGKAARRRPSARPTARISGSRTRGSARRRRRRWETRR